MPCNTTSGKSHCSYQQSLLAVIALLLSDAWVRSDTTTVVSSTARPSQAVIEAFSSKWHSVTVVLLCCARAAATGSLAEPPPRCAEPLSSAEHWQGPHQHFQRILFFKNLTLGTPVEDTTSPAASCAAILSLSVLRQVHPAMQLKPALLNQP